MTTKTKTSVTYVAQKRLKVGDGYRMPGEEVPEAAAWMNVDAYINRGMLAVVPARGSDNIEPRTQRGLSVEGGSAPRQRLVPQRFATSQDVEDLVEDHTKDELYERAQELDIDGRSDMNKDELAAAVAEAEIALEASQESSEGAGDPGTGEEDEGGGLTSEQYHAMSADEVKAAYDDGLLSIEEIDEFEDEREKGRRKGIDEWLDSLEEDEGDTEE